MSYVEAIEYVTPLQIAARRESIERRKRLGAPPRPVLRIVEKAPPAPTPEPSTGTAILVTDVNITSEQAVKLSDIALPHVAKMTDIPSPLRKSVKFDRIIGIVCSHYFITRAEIFGNRRLTRFVRPRQVAMYLCYELQLVDYSSNVLASRFGKDHTAVLHAIRKIRRLIDTNKTFAEELDSLRLACCEVTQ